MNKSKLDKIGVEIEGGWTKGHKCLPNVHYDGSINLPIPEYHSIRWVRPLSGWNKKYNVIGEIRSIPYSRLRSVEDWIKQNYPSVTNPTCGLHVHVSTKTLEAFSLFTQDRFYKLFLTGMEEWGKKHLGRTSEEDKAFWNRLEGKNTYCLRQFKPLRQLQGTDLKYTHLNFLAYREHGTLECRLLPAFSTLEKALLSVKFFVKLTDGFLEKAQPTTTTKKFLPLLQSIAQS
jgi:hypothetical protein